MLDWVGMDVKADPRDAAHFDRTAGAKGAAEHFLLSHRLLKESGVAHELRTTAHPDWLPDERLLSLADWLKSEAVDTFALQIYRRPPGGLLTGLFPAVGIDYPAPERRPPEGAVKHFVERRTTAEASAASLGRIASTSDAASGASRMRRRTSSKSLASIAA